MSYKNDYKIDGYFEYIAPPLEDFWWQDGIKDMDYSKKDRNVEGKMEFSTEELIEAKRQIDSTLHKLEETVKTFESKENVSRYKSQITLAKRRIQAFQIANCLIDNEIGK